MAGGARDAKFRSAFHPATVVLLGGTGESYSFGIRHSLGPCVTKDHKMTMKLALTLTLDEICVGVRKDEMCWGSYGRNIYWGSSEVVFFSMSVLWG